MENNRLFLKKIATKKFILIIGIILWLIYPPKVGFTLHLSLGCIRFFIVISFVLITLDVIFFFIERSSIYLYDILKVLILLIVSTAGNFYLKSLDNQAVGFLRNSAENIRSQCIKLKKCPVCLDGWKKIDDNDYCQYKYIGSGGTVFYIYYYPDNDHFNMYIHYGPDSEFHLYGSIKTPVSEDRYDDL
ncbi:hypothetical protein VU08_05510 [Desulfobulbus sp. F5]|nr:hypothetical protein [Desulfobulbus sp. F5]